MSDERKIRGKIDVGGLAGPIWVIGYLFTIGYLHLPFAKAFLALVLWPYYLGVKLGA